MAPLPDNATDTYFVDYTTGPIEHQFQVRTTTGASLAQVDGAINFVLNIMVGVLPDTWRVLGTSRRLQGSNLRFPVDLPLTLAFVGGNGSLNLAEWQEARELVFVGRGEGTGRRVELSLYGVLLQSQPNNYRIPSASATDGFVGDVVEALNAAAGAFICIGGDNALWYPYANVNFNSYWESELRTS